MEQIAEVRDAAGRDPPTVQPAVIFGREPHVLGRQAEGARRRVEVAQGEIQQAAENHYDPPRL
jgi:hypothetical protein